MTSRSKISPLVFILVIIIGFLSVVIYHKDKFIQNNFDIDSDNPTTKSIRNKIKEFVNKDKVCKKSEPGFTEDWLRSELESFLKVYENRPSVPNTYGTKLAHQFALWATIRWIKPLHIIESGIYQGLATWLMRQAAPDAQFILLDPHGSNLKYKDDKADTKYLTDSKFKDFSEVDWNSMNMNKDKTFIFFDDHQSGIIRTKQAYDRGFVHIMFDDNYTGPDGDNLSLKMSCLLKNGVHPPGSILFRTNFNKVKRPMTQEDLDLIKNVFENFIQIYYEFPLPWDFPASFPHVLLRNENPDSIKQRFNINKMDDVFIKIKEGYYNICYVKLQQKN